VTLATDPTRRAEVGVTLAVLLVLALPLLLAAFTLGTGGLPHDASLQAARAHDVSLAAMDRVDRFLHGDLNVSLAPAYEVAILAALLPPPEPPTLPPGAAPLALARALAGRVATDTALTL
jgi:hypothetical protein